MIESILQTDPISGPNLQAVTGAMLYLCSIQRGKQKRMETSDAQQVSLTAKLRPYIHELENYSPGTVPNVERRGEVSMHHTYLSKPHRKSKEVADPVRNRSVLWPLIQMKPHPHSSSNLMEHLVWLFDEGHLVDIVNFLC